MSWIPRSRLALAAATVGALVLALPAAAVANPGKGPELVRRSGQFVFLHADNRDGSSTRVPMVVDGLRQTPVRTPGDVWIEPGSQVRLEGSMQDGTLVVDDSLSAVSELAPARHAGGLSAAPSVETTAVVQFFFSGQSTGLPSNPDDTMTTNAKSLRNYYLEQTYNQIEFQTTVFAPVTLSTPPPSSCPTSVLDDWALEAESLTAGLDESQYQHLVYVFPAAGACSWSGIAELGGRHVWINGSFTVPVIAHELGHNLGVAHAGGLSCRLAGQVAPMGDTCSIDRAHYALPQYGDPFDAMGNQAVLRQMNMLHKLELGLLPASAVAVVTTSGTYQLAPMETLTGSVQLLRLPKPDGGSYYVEYRQPIGVFDGQSGSPSATGVLVHTESPDLTDPDIFVNGDSDTALVDMHPDSTFSSSQWWNAAMSPGQVFNDPVRGMAIQNLGQGPSGVTLAITMPADTVPPTRPGRLTGLLVGTTVSLQWIASADDRGGAVSYVVARDGATLGTTDALAFTDAAAPQGATVTYTVVPVDAAGNAGLSATVSVAIPDITAPSGIGGVTAKLMRDGTVHVAWRAATDNRAVTSYRVLRNTTVVGQPAGLSLIDKAPRPGSGATVTYSVVALDAAGNGGPAGKATPLRAALLRELGASRLKAVRAKGKVRVKGTVSDVKASCRLRIGKGAWKPCKARSNGTFSVTLPAKGTTPVTLRLRDALGRVKVQTLRVR